MTLSSKQIGDIANLYESIIASEQENQLDEDLIGDIISNRGKIKSAATKAASATGKALSATNKAIGGTVSSAVRGASSTAKDVAKGFQYGGSTGGAAVLGGRIAQGIMNAGKKPPVPVTPDSKRDPEFRRGAGAGAGDMDAGKKPPVPVTVAAKPTPAPAKPAAVAAKPAAAPKTPSMGSVGGVKFERRAATRAELDAARAAREAAKGAGKSKSEQELSAVKAGVEASKVKKEEYDAYDLVLEYLLSQGHVETVEEALYVMMEMDAEVIQDIVSEQSNTLLTPEQRRADELKYGAKRTTQVPPARPSGMKAKPGSRMPL
jgi:hypothetical protein